MIRSAVEGSWPPDPAYLELSGYLPAERLLICPSCGFGRRDLHIAIGKTKAMVSASKTIMA